MKINIKFVFFLNCIVTVKYLNKDIKLIVKNFYSDFGYAALFANQY